MALIRSGTPPTSIRTIGSVTFRDTPQRVTCPECDWVSYDPEFLSAHMGTAHRLEPEWVARARANRLPAKVLR